MNSPENIESYMFRVENENIALILSLTVALVVGVVFSTFDFAVFIGLIIAGLTYIKLHQAQYIGSSIRVHSGQFPEIYAVFRDQAIRLNIPKASLYISQDPYLNAFSLGINSCTVILTSSLVEQLTLPELSFAIAHELGHFKAGHTKITSFVDPLGSSNFVSNYLFGWWKRKAEYSCDRCALILTKDVDVGISTMLKLSVGAKLYKQISLEGFVKQYKNADGNWTKASELLLDHPLTTNRIKSLLNFWKTNFHQPATHELS